MHTNIHRHTHFTNCPSQEIDRFESRSHNTYLIRSERSCTLLLRKIKVKEGENKTYQIDHFNIILILNNQIPLATPRFFNCCSPVLTLVGSVDVIHDKRTQS